MGMQFWSMRREKSPHSLGHPLADGCPLYRSTQNGAHNRGHGVVHRAAEQPTALGSRPDCHLARMAGVRLVIPHGMLHAALGATAGFACKFLAGCCCIQNPLLIGRGTSTTQACRKGAKLTSELHPG